jgi:hypothetical protein
MANVRKSDVAPGYPPEEGCFLRGKDYTLCDAGAYQEPPLSGKITWRITDPQRQPKTDEQRSKMEKAHALMERIRKSVEAKKQRG